MPMVKSRYPKDWAAISLEARQRAGQCCEWCGAANGSLVERAGGKLTKIVLTVHHIGTPVGGADYGDPHNKMDCRAENLIALCQKHHLAADAEIRRLEDKWRRGFGAVVARLGRIPDKVICHPKQGGVYLRLREIVAARTNERAA